MISPVLHILAATVLDQLLGDPRSLPHPVRFIGSLGLGLEKIFRKSPLPLRAAGVVTLGLMLLASTGTVFSILHLAGLIHPMFATALSVIILYTTIAARDLCRHSKAVYQALQEHDLEKARDKVGMIVGRETTNLNKEEVARAAVESVAESIVDGVCAPLFYAFLGGLAAAMCYKAINTADSMFGYKNEKYAQFGWASARLDDLANFIPARLTALLIPVAAFLLRLDSTSSRRILARDRHNHSSPNAGHSEAAVAGALGIRLGGANIYFGKLVEKPTIGDAERPVAADHILLTNRLMLTTTALLICLMTLLMTAAELLIS